MDPELIDDAFREQALGYVSYVLDTALSPDHTKADISPGAVLVGWQCGFEPLFVAVIAASVDPQGQRDGVELGDAEEIAMDYLDEIGWFGHNAPTVPDYIFTVR